MDGITILDPDMRVSLATSSAEILFGYASDSLHGVNILELVHPDDRSQAAEHLLACQRTPGRPGVVLVRMRDASGTWQALMLRCVAVALPGRRPAITVTFAQSGDPQAKERYEDVVRRVRRLLNATAGLQDVVVDLLEAIAVGLGWDIAEFWYLDHRRGTLRRVAVWHREDPSLAPVVETGADLEFAPGHDLPGRTWQVSSTVVISDLYTHPGFCRSSQAAAAGLRVGCGVPVMHGNQLFGAMILMGRQQLVNDDHLICLAELGETIGRHLAHSWAEFRWLAVLEAAPDAIVVVDSAGHIVMANARTTELFGYRPDELIGQPVEVLVPVHLREVHRVHRQRYREAPRSRPMGIGLELVALRRDGTEVPVEISLSPLQSEHQQLVIAVIRDSSERMQLEAVARAEAERAQAIFDHAPLGLALVSQEGVLMRCNAALKKLLGISAEQAEQRPILSFVHPDDRPWLARLVSDLRSGTRQSVQLEVRCVRPGKESVWVRLNVALLRASAGEPASFLVTVEDVTARRRSEAARRRSERRYRALFNEAPVALHELDAHGRIVRVNRTALELLGYSAREMIGRPVWDFAADPATLRDAVEAAMTGRRPPRQQDERVFRRKDGVEVPILLSARLLRDAQGRYCGMRVALQDISEQKRVEQALLEERVKTEKLEALSLLAGGIAHDFNNLLAAILGNLSLIRDAAAPDCLSHQFVQEAERACERAIALTRQLLTFAKGGAPIVQTVELSEVVRDVATFVTRGTAVRCEFELPSDLWAVKADAGQISQVVQNLVLNAQQAMPDGGVIRISASNVQVSGGTDGSLKGMPVADGPYVRLAVQDQGVGIAPENLPRIFDPYFTTKPGGMGLGLASVYSIVRRHGGHITVRSTPGEGTTFTVLLPATTSGMEHGPTPAQERRVRDHGYGAILVVDDEPAIRSLLARMLGHLGYRVDAVPDGTSALERYRQARVAGTPYDLVLTDLTIPGGMGGRELVAALREIDPHPRVVASSGYAHDPIMAEYQKYGFSAVLPKPYRLADLQRVLANVLAETR